MISQNTSDRIYDSNCSRSGDRFEIRDDNIIVDSEIELFNLCLENQKLGTTVEIWTRAINSSFGLFDHHFLIIGNYEYHLSRCSRSRIIPKGTTKNAHLSGLRQVCGICLAKIFNDYRNSENVRLFSLYPLVVNCETVAKGFSLQAIITLTCGMFSIWAIIKKHWYLCIIFILLSFTLCLIVSKYNYSRTAKSKCEHLSLKS